VYRLGKRLALYWARAEFAACHQGGTPSLRRLASWILAEAYPMTERSLALECAPPGVEVVYNARGQDRLVHLINAGNRVEGIRVKAVVGKRPKAVVAVPEKKPIGFEWSNGQLTFGALPLYIHSAYQIEVPT
jgi:hypothetical protein